MTIEDADKMLEWKNYSETRQFAIASHDEITKEAHYEWLKNNLQYFQIIGDGIGAVRIQDNEVSIWVDRGYRGYGVAAMVLELVSEKGMTAKIVDGNVASMRSFIKAGFIPTSHVDNYYILTR